MPVENAPKGIPLLLTEEIHHPSITLEKVRNPLGQSKTFR
jgi:hypothetical protein